MSIKGHKVSKYFDEFDDEGKLISGGYFKGFIDRVSRDGPNIVWFHVLYDDMDEEEYELTEVLSILDFGARNVKPTRNREKALPDAEQLKIVTGMKSNAMEAASTFVSDLRKLSPTEGGCACCTGVGGCARDCTLTQSSKVDDYCLDLAKMIDVVPG